jgi:hypothetical protein
VAGLVDEPHGKQLPGVHGLLRMLFDVAHLVHAVRELAARRQIGQNHIAVV